MKFLFALPLLLVPTAVGLATSVSLRLDPAPSPQPSVLLNPGAALAIGAEEYKIDEVHSTAMFRAWHMGVAYFYGTLGTISGEITIDDEDPDGCFVELAIDATGVHSGNKGRDKHIKSPDFFNVKEFPEMTFISDEVEKTEDGWKVTGELTVRGESKTMTVEVVETGRGETKQGYKIGLALEFDIDTGDFGMPAAKKMSVDMLDSKVHLMLGLQAKRL